MDEVGDMAPATQAKLLRLLQEQQFERVGGNATIHTDVRVIAATNQDLESLVAAGRFRQDLFYRLNVLTIHIPPLRERIDDIPLLVDYFLGRMNRELDRHVYGVSPEAMQLLKQHTWPGNVRELQKRDQARPDPHAAATSSRRTLPVHLREGSAPAHALRRPATWRSGGWSANCWSKAATATLLPRAGGRRPRDARFVLEHARGNQVEAAELLGISRNTLRSKLRNLRLVVEKQLNDRGEGGQE